MRLARLLINDQRIGRHRRQDRIARRFESGQPQVLQRFIEGIDFSLGDDCRERVPWQVDAPLVLPREPDEFLLSAVRRPDHARIAGGPERGEKRDDRDTGSYRPEVKSDP